MRRNWLLFARNTWKQSVSLYLNHNHEDDDLLESGIAAKEITQTMHEDRRSYARDEIVYSVVFSFNKKLQTEKNNGN